MKRKVLIVEDHADVRELIRIALEMEDFDLHEASDGQHALRLLASLKPDLVLSDVMMPGVDGLELCRRIKADAGLRHTKLVLLSARGQPQDRAAGLKAGADAYLVKPFGPLDLLDTVRRLAG